MRGTSLQLANKKTTIIDKENITPTGLKSQQQQNSKPMKKEFSLKPSNKLDLKRKLQSTTISPPPSGQYKSPSKKKKFAIFEDQTFKVNRVNSSSPINSPTILLDQTINTTSTTITNTIIQPVLETTSTQNTIIQYEIVEEEAIIQPYLEKIKILENEIIELTNDKTYYQLMYNTLSINSDTRLTIDSLKQQITILETTKNVFRNKILSLAKEKEMMKSDFENQLNLQKQADKHLREVMQQTHEEEVLQLQSEIEQLKNKLQTN
ncbi:predicted protein [Naegleria gruberi]|uniref:Predicted protein n=1 Tax=Naegleria gruberi TaxID=5762 RepID=D2V9Q1_NAEGR|nr:uncharacterized protein NAEGRDRAFT_47745 [Naegleria gruberi]EFC46626.1 predicted protein [Naegleria gruberi]|eukprot:XP_002679370.1 predicted protein [Naegleria gruberi strain NEG-M]